MKCRSCCLLFTEETLISRHSSVKVTEDKGQFLLTNPIPLFTSFTESPAESKLELLVKERKAASAIGKEVVIMRSCLASCFHSSTRVLSNCFKMSYEKEDRHTDISLLIPKRPHDAMTEPVEGMRRPDSPVDPAPGPSQPAKTQSPGLNRPRKS